MEFAVSLRVQHSNPGTLDKTLSYAGKAASAVRAQISKGIPANGIVVWLRGGDYERNTTLTLSASDSGTSATNNVDWRGYPGEKVRLIGGKKSSMPISDRSQCFSGLVPHRRQRQGEGAAGGSETGSWHHCNIDRGREAEAYGVLNPRGFGDRANYNAPLELFIDTQPMTLARWPSASSATMPLQDINGNTFQLFGKNDARCQWQLHQDRHVRRCFALQA